MKEQQMAVIVYENISKTFDGGKTYAVDGVSAEIEKGEFVTILGSSGCGKTTLLKLTNRLYEPDGGRAYFAPSLLYFPVVFGKRDPEKIPGVSGYRA